MFEKLNYWIIDGMMSLMSMSMMRLMTINEFHYFSK